MTRWTLRPAGALASMAVVALAMLTLARPAAAVTVPPQFVVENFVPGGTLDNPVGIAFFPSGRMLVAEKRGTVWSVLNGIKAPTPMVSIDSEVLDNGDRGLLDVAIDPNYAVTRWIFLLYTVDPDSNGIDDNAGGFGRVVRYQVSPIDSNVVVPSSRTVLIGRSFRFGPPSCSLSHTIGSLRWGRDGSLLISSGEGASFTVVDPGGLDPLVFGAGPNLADPLEDIGAFRSQYLGSFGGKVLRINPATGVGYPSNPYYDGDLDSYASRIWCYGLRNPFRFTVRPGSGSTDPAVGNPGTLYIGDVGAGSFEEMDIARQGGVNFGWPCYEGFEQYSEYQNAAPAHNGCNTIGTPINPTTPSAPVAAWSHVDPALSFPAGVEGNASIGGTFYTGTRYPAPYRLQYFFGDYGRDWIKLAQVDANDNLIQIQTFADGCNSPVDIQVDPVSGDLVYIALAVDQVRRIRYTGAGGNGAPVAVAIASPTVGVIPLTVNFTGSGSYDPDGDAIMLTWIFGDGQGAATTNPAHLYNVAGTYSAILTADDGKGGIGRDTVVVIAASSSNFPSTPVLDAFDRANGPIGGSWVDPLYNLGGLFINSNALIQNCCAYGAPIWNGSVFGADQEAYLTLTQVTAGATETDLMLKLQGGTYSGAHVEVRYDDNSKSVQVATWDPSTGWVNRGAAMPVSFQAGDQFGARAYSNGTVGVYRNAVLLGTVSLGSWTYATQGGRIGLTLSGCYASRFENFGGGNAVLTSNTPPTAIILSPTDQTYFAAGDTIHLNGSGTDAQQPANTLAYHWAMNLHHNNHVHPNYVNLNGQNVTFIGENHDDGTGVFDEIQLTVTDAGSLQNSAIVNIYPEVDLTPSSITVTPPLPGNLSPSTYSFVLNNLGRMPAPISHWRMIGDNTVVAEGDTLVPALTGVTVTRTVPALLAAGPHTLRVTADTLATVVETNESNNSASQSITVVAEALGVPGGPRPLALSAARPMPSSGAVNMTLMLPSASRVEFRVVDVQGREIWSAPGAELSAGERTLTWAGNDASGSRVRPGLYLARVTVGTQAWTRRLIIFR